MCTFDITNDPSYLYGTIHLRDGRSVKEVVTKHQAFEASNALLNVQISRKEWLDLRQQIWSSPLPNQDDKLESAFKRDIEFLNEAFVLLRQQVQARIAQLSNQ